MAGESRRALAAAQFFTNLVSETDTKQRDAAQRSHARVPAPQVAGSVALGADAQLADCGPRLRRICSADRSSAGQGAGAAAVLRAGRVRVRCPVRAGEEGNARQDETRKDAQEIDSVLPLLLLLPRVLLRHSKC